MAVEQHAQDKQSTCPAKSHKKQTDCADCIEPDGALACASLAVGVVLAVVVDGVERRSMLSVALWSQGGKRRSGDQGVH